jgi:hypothetical protein
MNETLFSQIQRLFERTYAQVGINLEDCIIDRARSLQLSKLAGASARELNELARTFLRHAGDQLYVGIYYSRWLIDQLERHDPRSGLSDSNIRLGRICAQSRVAGASRYLSCPSLIRRFFSQNPARFPDRSPLAAFSSFHAAMPRSLSR